MTSRLLIPPPDSTNRREPNELCRGARHGYVEGVEVDFRHPDLPPSEWEPRIGWHAWFDSPDSAGVIFPSEAKTPLREFREQRGVDAEFAAVYVRAGDRLCIDRVVSEVAEARLDHSHDREQRCAYLQIARKSGEVEKLVKPMTFYGTTQIREGAPRHAFDHMIERLCRSSGLGRVEDFSEEKRRLGFSEYPLWDNALEVIALHAAYHAHQALFYLMDMLPENGSPHDRGERLTLQMIANYTALAAFLLAKSEMQKHEAIALATLSNLERGTLKITRADWREKAKIIWRDNPRRTVNAVAREIAEGSDDDVRSISRAIKPLAPPTSPSFKGPPDNPADRQ